MISKNEFILLFIFVTLDQLTTYFGYFYYHFEEINIIGNLILKHFGKFGIILTFIHELLGTIALFCFVRFLRIKVFKTNVKAEYLAMFMPLIASLNNTIICLLN